MVSANEMHNQVVEFRSAILKDSEPKSVPVISTEPLQENPFKEGEKKEMANEKVMQKFEQEITSKSQQKAVTESAKKRKSSNSDTLIIGVGAGGAAAATLGTKYGFKTMGVNTAEEDLVGLDLQKTFIIKDALGSGKERKRAKNLFIADADRFMENMKENYDMLSIDNIIVVYTGGGGTGAGIGPMMARHLANNFTGSNVFAAVLLGLVNEDIKSQENMRDTIEDTIKASVNYLVFDNERAEGKSFSEIYNKVNSEFIGACRVIAGEYIKPCRNNIDPADIQKLWLEKRRLHIISGKFDRKLTTGKNIEEQIINAVNDSLQAPMGNTPEWLNVGIIINVEDKYYSDIDETFRNVVNFTGEPYEMYRHLQVRELSDDTPDYALIMAGLNEPLERYETINTRISEFLERRKQTDSLNSANRIVIERRVDPEFVPKKVESTMVDKSAFDDFN